MSARATLAVAICSTVLLALAAPAAAAGDRRLTSSTSRPNIVVFYMDDVAPIDGRLWSDPALTPTLYDLFVAHGIHFANAIGETPLCCPGRAGLLTGLHTHNHGVYKNDARLFNPGEHVGGELEQAGYATMWVGKYLNKNQLLSAAAWQQHGRGWTYLDAIISLGNGFYDYRLHTKSGVLPFGRYHSTRMAAERTVMHMREVAANQPIFSVVSIYNLHGPNIPMPEFETDPRCRAMPPWRPPNYNEADVSDKPAAIRALPLLPQANGWPMLGYCREMLGVDWAARQVVNELRAEGRLENTLFVLTADNGMGWGAHRLGQKKSVPYATPVPLYFSWPARWAAPRTISEPVSDIDLAPTLCELGGCTMGPYPTGQTHADGVSLVPLLAGKAVHLGRDAVLEQLGNGEQGWTGLRTTAINPLGRWHYVEYQTGERELYDLAGDPWELYNRAGDPGLAQVRPALAVRLAKLRAEGVVLQPDASAAVALTRAFIGDGIYARSPTSGQTLKERRSRTGATYSFVVRIDNDAGIADSILVRAVNAGPTRASVRYTRSGVDITPQITAGTYRIDGLAAHASAELQVLAVMDSAAPPGSRTRIVISVSSAANLSRTDVLTLLCVH